jgi:hypothetical protein
MLLDGKQSKEKEMKKFLMFVCSVFVSTAIFGADLEEANQAIDIAEQAKMNTNSSRAITVDFKYAASAAIAATTNAVNNYEGENKEFALLMLESVAGTYSEGEERYNWGVTAHSLGLQFLEEAKEARDTGAYAQAVTIAGQSTSKLNLATSHFNNSDSPFQNVTSTCGIILQLLVEETP